MANYAVEPYIPDEDYDNPAMVTDFYEFTMANCLFLHGFKDKRLVFDKFLGKNRMRKFCLYLSKLHLFRFCPSFCLLE